MNSPYFTEVSGDFGDAAKLFKTFPQGVASGAFRYFANINDLPVLYLLGGM